MDRAPVWFERKFDFTFPVELHPNLCARLRGTAARLEEIAGQAAPALLVQRPAPDKWSAQEHAGHLYDLEALWLARVEDYGAGVSQLTVADLTNRKTYEAHHNERPIDEILAHFRRARAVLVSRVEAIDPSQFSRAIPHPRLKTPMRLVDHLFFVAEHDDHHLAMMWQLLNSK